MQIFTITQTALQSISKSLTARSHHHYLKTKSKLANDWNFSINVEVISRGNGITLTEIRDINTKEDIGIKNNEVKSVLVEFLGDSIQFCELNRKNQSLMVFSSSLDISDVINTLLALDSVKVAAKVIRSKLLNVDFGLQDKFCDAEEGQRRFQMSY